MTRESVNSSSKSVPSAGQAILSVLPTARSSGSGCKITDGQPGLTRRELLMKYMVFTSMFILLVDLIYKSVFGITYSNREDCILYTNLPHIGFLVYEYLVELMLVVILGVYIAALIERRFSRIRRFMPTNPFTAFLYASLIPVCSCTAIPLVKAMKDKVPLRVVISFVVAAPLLNPYIIVLSTMVLGPRYTLLRVGCSLILAVSTGFIVERFVRLSEKSTLDPRTFKNDKGCKRKTGNVYESVYVILREAFPYLLAAGLLGITIEYLVPVKLLKGIDFNGNMLGTLSVMAVGVPIYLCNGADVLFMQPLLLNGHFQLGTAMAFSLTSTSVCVTSLVLLAKFLGRKPTLVILLCVVSITLILSQVIQFIYS